MEKWSKLYAKDKWNRKHGSSRVSKGNVKNTIKKIEKEQTQQHKYTYMEGKQEIEEWRENNYRIITLYTL